MKKLILTFAGTMVALALLLPFASKTPDGLETLVENYASHEEPAWKGLMADYSVAFADPYFSTLIAALFGTSMLMVAGFVLGAILTHTKKSRTPKL